MIRFSSEQLGFGIGDGLSSQPAATPTSLEVESTGDTIHIQQLTGHIEPWTAMTFHRGQIHLAQGDSTSSDELLTKWAPALNLQALSAETIDQLALSF